MSLSVPGLTEVIKNKKKKHIMISLLFGSDFEKGGLIFSRLITFLGIFFAHERGSAERDFWGPLWA